MTTAETDLVRDLFAARVSDLTPLAARQSARVLYVPVARDPETSSRCASILSDNERQRAARLKPEDEKDRFVQRRAFRRFCGATALGSSRPLSETVFEETEKGRPYLLDSPSLWFSFSSSRRGFLGAWSFTHAIGIDLEDPARELNATDLARQYFSAAEAEVVGAAVGPERLRTFYRFWTLKEAALKSIGEGLPFGREVEVVDPHRQRGLQHRRSRAQDPAGDVHRHDVDLADAGVDERGGKGFVEDDRGGEGQIGRGACDKRTVRLVGELDRNLEDECIDCAAQAVSALLGRWGSAAASGPCATICVAAPGVDAEHEQEIRDEAFHQPELDGRRVSRQRTWPGAFGACPMTVSGDPMDRFGLSSSVARCVSPLTEGAQREIPFTKTSGIELI